MGKLTNAKIKAIKPTGEHKLYGDGGTLYLSVSKGGTKSWVQRVVIRGRRTDIGLGGFPVVTLKRAREKALANRRAIDERRDPLAEKRKAKVPTFREAAQATAEEKVKRLRSTTAEQWLDFLDRYAMARLGDRRIDEIEQADVLSVLKPIWTAKPPTARKVRRGIKATLAWSQAHGFIQHNPAGEAIDGALPSMPTVKAHHRALPHAEVADALATVEASGATPSAKLAFRFIVLTAVRSGEARGATWDEIDMDARVWTIPASRMKVKKDHRVPLSNAAMAVLDRARALGDGTGLLFPSPRRRGKPLSSITLLGVLKHNGLADRATVHGFRSSFRDWCADTGRPREIAEAALAHTVKGVEGDYFRSDLFDRRRDLMAAWADYATGAEPGKVVAFPA